MTEIQSGNNFNVTNRFMQEAHKAAADNTVDAKEIARLVQVAAEDPAGLSDDEKKLIESLYTGKLDTSSLSTEEKALVNKLATKSDTSQAVLDQNIQTLRNVTAHESNPNQLDFSKVKLVSETKGFWGSIFGGSEKTDYGVNITDATPASSSNTASGSTAPTPSVSNPAETTNMAERSAIERNNYLNTLKPIEEELKVGMAENSDLRQRLFLSLEGNPEYPELEGPNDSRITEKIQELQNKITAFKNDPNKGAWESSDTLTALMDSYAKNPPVDNPRINAAAMGTLLGAFWNASETNDLKQEQADNFAEGNIQTPPSAEEINQTLNSLNTTAQTDAEKVVAQAEAMIQQLDGLKTSNSNLYAQVMRGTDESGLNLLRTQVSELKQHLASGAPMGPAQMNQFNNIYGNLHQMEKTLNLEVPANTNAEMLTVLEQRLAAAMNENEKASIKAEMAKITSAPQMSAENQQQLTALQTSFEDLQSSVYDASVSSSDVAKARSNMIHELQQVEQSLTGLLSQQGITEAGRKNLQGQLEATRTALTQLKAGQDLKVEPAEAFTQVLSTLQKMKPPAESTVSMPATTAGTALTQPFSPTLEYASRPPSYSLPDLNTGFNSNFNSAYTFSAGVPPLLTKPEFSFSGYHPSPLLSPYSFSASPNSSFSFGGFSGIGSSLNYLSPGLNLSPALLSPGSSSVSPSTHTPPDLSRLLLEGVGENTGIVVPLSEQMQQSKQQALEIIKEIKNDPDASEELIHSLASLEHTLQNPKSDNDPAFTSVVKILDSYKQLKAMPVPTGSDTQTNLSTEEAGVLLRAADEAIKTGNFNGQSLTELAVASEKTVRDGKDKPAEVREGLRNIYAAEMSQDIQNRLNTISDLTARDPGLMRDLAKDVFDANEIIRKNFLTQVQKIEGGKDITDVAAALDFLKREGKDTVPSYVLQVARSPEFKQVAQNRISAAQDRVKTAEDNLKTATDQEQALLAQVKALNIRGAQNVSSLDDAIDLLKKSGTTQKNLLTQLETVKQAKITATSALNSATTIANQASIDLNQIQTYGSTVTALQTEIDQTITSLQRLTPPDQTQIELLTQLKTDLDTSGKPNPDTLGVFARLKVDRQMSGIEAIIQRQTDLTSEQRQDISSFFRPFRRGNLQQREQLVQNLIEAIESGRVPVRGTVIQDALLRTLGLSQTGGTPLSQTELAARLRQWNPTQQMQTIVHQGATLQAGHDIARANLEGSVNPDRTTGVDGGSPRAGASGFTALTAGTGMVGGGFTAAGTSATGTDTGGSSFTATTTAGAGSGLGSVGARTQAYIDQAMNAASNPSTTESSGNSALQIYNADVQREETERERLLALPPEQQAAAWGELADQLLATNEIMNQMTNRFAEIVKPLAEANDQSLIAHGYPPLSETTDLAPTTEAPQADLSPEAEALIAEADAAADMLLAPTPTVSGEQFLSDLVRHFLDRIRELDFETRKLVMAQVAQRMMNNAITRMYKEKADENAAYHEKALKEMSQGLKQQIQQMLEQTLAASADSGQAAMAVGGQLGGKTGMAIQMSDKGLRESFGQMLEGPTKSELMTRVQKQKILQTLFEGSRITGQEGIMALLDRFQNENQGLSRN